MSEQDLRFFTDASCDPNVSVLAVRGVFRDRILKVIVLLPPISPQEAELLAGVFGLSLAKFVNGRDSGEPQFTGFATLHWNLDNPLLVNDLRSEKFVENPDANYPNPLLPTSVAHSSSSSSLLNRAIQHLRMVIREQKLTVVYVRAHSGIRENELCDKACHWARTKGLALLSGRKAAFCGAVAKIRRREAWLLANFVNDDAQNFIEESDSRAARIVAEFYPELLPN